MTVFTAAEQLYRVAVNVEWVCPELSDDFVLRFMSFVGSVGALMEKQWTRGSVESSVWWRDSNVDREEFPSEHKSSSNGSRGVAPANHFESRKSRRSCVHFGDGSNKEQDCKGLGRKPNHTCADHDDLCSSRTGG